MPTSGSALPLIQVVNQRKDKTGEYIGRPSVLGNDFSHMPNTLAQHKVETREEAIAAFKMRLESDLRIGKPEVIKELDRLANIAINTGSLKLRCWCAPLPCHGDVIKDFILNAIKGEL